MVSSLRSNGKGSVVLASKAEQTEPQETNQNTDNHEAQENKEPVYWLDRNPMLIKNYPLSSDMLEGEVYHTTEKGYVTVLDSKYVCYRIGQLFDQLGFTAEDIGTEDVSNFVEDLFNYYFKLYPEEKRQKEEAKLQEQRESIIARAIPQLRKMASVMGQRDRLNWTDDEWISFMKSQP